MRQSVSILVLCLLLMGCAPLMTAPDPQPQVVSTSFDDFSMLCNDSATASQKEARFNELKDHYIEWRGEVIGTVPYITGEEGIQVKHCAGTQSSDILVMLRTDQRRIAVHLFLGDVITYRARLVKFDSLLPLVATDGVIVPTQ